MNCERACQLIDDYLESQLSRLERQRLETHLASCAGCVEQLRTRSAFEHAIGHTLAASVQHRTLPPETSTRIIRAAQGSGRRAVWSNHAFWAARTMATLVAASLVLVGMFLLMERIPTAAGPRPVTLFPVIQLVLSELSPDTFSLLNQPTLSEPELVTNTPGDQRALTLRNSDLRIEPGDLQPSERFTITLILHSDLPQPVDTARLDLEISGPPGRFRFPLTVGGPLPAPGVSILQVTPDQLAVPCRKQYLISPTDMFEVPGIYTVRVTLFSPVLSRDQ